MQTSIRFGFLIALACLLLQGIPVRGEEAANVVHKIDQLYRADSSHGTMEMEISTPDWQRTLAMEVWSRGLDKTFVRIEKPAKERGVATLRIGNEMWNYLPKTNKVIKIPPSMMMSSWMGSDFTNDDLVKEFTFLDDYTFEFVHPDDAVEGELYINCVPKSDRPIVWGNVLIAVRADTLLPVWQKYFDEGKQLMRTLSYGDVKELGGRTIPATMEMVPATKEGHRTIVRYLEITFNANLSEEVFSLRNLRANP